jgi:hypothetical protein
VLGAAVTLGVGYLYTKEYQTFVVHAPYVRAASEAKLDVALMRKIKAGDLVGASELTEARLKIHEDTLAEYRRQFPREEQDAAVLAGAAAIEKYRSEASR